MALEDEDETTPSKPRGISQESIRTEAKNLNSYLRAMQKFALKVQSEYIPLYKGLLPESKSISELNTMLNEDLGSPEGSELNDFELTSLEEESTESEDLGSPEGSELSELVGVKDLDLDDFDLTSLLESDEPTESIPKSTKSPKSPKSPSESTESPSESTEPTALPKGLVENQLEKFKRFRENDPKKTSSYKSLYKNASNESDIGPDIVNQLENLTIDFIGTRNQVESKMANALKMDSSEFRSRFKIEDYIRLFLEIDPTLTKIAQIFDQGENRLTPSAPKRYESKAIEKHEFVHKTVLDVLGGRFSFQPYRSTSLHLYSHSDILNAWEYMHLQLGLHYDSFLRTIIRLAERQKAHQKGEIPEQDPIEQGQKLALVEQELLNRLVRAIGVVGNA
jgi:hypothetical protein